MVIEYAMTYLEYDRCLFQQVWKSFDIQFKSMNHVLHRLQIRGVVRVAVNVNEDSTKLLYCPQKVLCDQQLFHQNKRG